MSGSRACGPPQGALSCPRQPRRGSPGGPSGPASPRAGRGRPGGSGSRPPASVAGRSARRGRGRGRAPRGSGATRGPRYHVALRGKEGTRAYEALLLSFHVEDAQTCEVESRKLQIERRAGPPVGGRYQETGGPTVRTRTARSTANVAPRTIPGRRSGRGGEGRRPLTRGAGGERGPRGGGRGRGGRSRG